VAYLQSLSENKGAAFQIASNFNCLEVITEIVSPDLPQFTEKYFRDRTQGPAASVSAGGAAITRVHCAFFAPNTPIVDWRQTATHQVNILGQLNKFFPMRNGYVTLHGKEPKFPKLHGKKYFKHLAKVAVGYHEGAQVTTGHRSQTLERVTDPSQSVDQVFCAAMNLSQGPTGMKNSMVKDHLVKAQFVLEAMYTGTYLSALIHKKKHLFLTLVGGGAFGNEKEWIFEAIFAAHKRWGKHAESALEKVTIALFNENDLWPGTFKRMTGLLIPFTFTVYEAGKARLVKEFDGKPPQVEPSSNSDGAY